MRVIESEMVRNFEEVIPEVEAAREEVHSEAVTIAGLRHILSLLREQAEGTRIPSKILLALLKHLVVRLWLPRATDSSTDCCASHGGASPSSRLRNSST